MSGSGDSTLLELFREEVRANVQVLNDGLVALEQDPTATGQIEPLMRAAHSVKGAARVVNIDAAVTLAHAAEDCLVAAQESRITLNANDIDTLLKAADLLAGIAESAGPNLPQWLAQSGSEIDELSNALINRSQGKEDVVPVPQPPAAILEQASGGTEDSAALAAAIDADRARTFDPSPMVDLFRDETNKSAAILQEAVASSKQAAPEGEALASLVRAVQSVKSAARMVNVEVAFELAGFMEGILERAQAGNAALDPASVDTISKSTELLAQVAEAVGPDYAVWLDANSNALNQAGNGSQLVEKVAAVPASPPAEQEVLPTAVIPTPRPAEPIARQKKPKSAEQVVRVTAQSLTRLMGLAGESLVEARWLQPFSKSLLELKRQQGLLGDSLDELHQLIPPDEEGDRRTALLVEASARLTECRQMLASQIGEFENRARNADDLNSRLYHEVIASRMRPFGDGVQGFPRMVRDLARQLNKKVAFKVLGETTDVDRDILEKLEAPLNHILRNALDHGLEAPSERAEQGKPETCKLEIEARHNAGMLVITVTDDGRGIDLEKIRTNVIDRNLADERIAKELSDAELLEFLFLPAFSTATGVTEVSGRGVGLDVVHSMVHSVGGSVRIQSQPGEGTTFQLELPITLSVIRAVLVNIAGEPYAFPHNRIDRLVRITSNDLHSLENRLYFEVDGSNVGVVLAREILGMESAPAENDSLFVILFSHHSDQYGLVVDEFCGERDLVVRPLDQRLGKVPNINAAAILDDGSPVLIVDLDDLRRSIERKLHSDQLGRTRDRGTALGETPAKRILVVDDSITVREVQRQLLANQGYDVEVAVDGMEGWNMLSQSRFDLVISDIDMPRLNGIDFVRMIKNDPQLRTTPVVIVSYKDREEDRLRGMDAGADYYLTKSSFHDETLLGAVQDLIGDAH